MKRIESPPGTQAVVRAIRLLKSFSAHQPKMSLAELGASLGLTKTTAHRLLAALESEGLVGRDEVHGTYHLGPAMIALGSQALLTSDLRTAARPSLEAIAMECQETTTLEVLVGDHMLVLDGVAGRHLISATLDIGTRWPIHATSTGKALLAHAQELTRDQLISAPLKRFTDSTQTRKAELMAELKAVKERGYAVAQEELEVGYVAVAAEFRGPDGEIEGALSIGGPTSRFTRGKIRVLGGRLRAAADQLSLRRQREA